MVNLYLGELQKAIGAMELAPRKKVKFEEDIDNIRIAMGNSPAADVAVQVRSFVETEILGKICSNGQKEASAILEMETPDEKLEPLNEIMNVDKVRRESRGDRIGL